MFSIATFEICLELIYAEKRYLSEDKMLCQLTAEFLVCHENLQHEQTIQDIKWRL
jgi:hypothetical protein